MAYNFRRTLAGAMLAEIVDENDALKRIKSASIWFYIFAGIDVALWISTQMPLLLIDIGVISVSALTLHIKKSRIAASILLIGCALISANVMTSWIEVGYPKGYGVLTVIGLIAGIGATKATFWYHANRN